MAQSKAVIRIGYNYLSRNCGQKVSNICLGTMTFGESTWGFPEQSTEEVAHQILDRYVEHGGNFVDTADVYSLGKSEQFIGNWFQKRQNRSQIVLATKVRLPDNPMEMSTGGLSRNYILTRVEDSLKRLKTDYIDLYQIHGWDDATPLRETLSTLNDLVRAGTVRYVGACNMSGWQLQKIVDLNHYMGHDPFVTLQQEYNLINRQSELEPFEVCRREGLGVLPWSPMKGGLLTGKFKKGQDLPADTRVGTLTKSDHPVLNFLAAGMGEENYWKIIETMENIGKDIGRSIPQVALRWVMQKEPVTSVIIGAKTVAQLEDNMAAGTDWELSDEQMTSLDEASSTSPGFLYTFLAGINIERMRRLPSQF